MSLERYRPEGEELDPGTGEVETAELVVEDDVLVKAFALGPEAELERHEHPDSTNVFHILEGTVTVLQGDTRERVDAPGVLVHERGVDHGARNETDGTAIFTASLCPLDS